VCLRGLPELGRKPVASPATAPTTPDPLPWGRCIEGIEKKFVLYQRQLPENGGRISDKLKLPLAEVEVGAEILLKIGREFGKRASRIRRYIRMRAW
jgi:hypothetical protein